MNRLLRAFLGSLGASLVLTAAVFLIVWALNPPTGCSLSWVATGQRCPGDRLGIIANALIILAVVTVIHLVALTIYRVRRRRAAHTATGEQK